MFDEGGHLFEFGGDLDGDLLVGACMGLYRDLSAWIGIKGSEGLFVGLY